VRLLGLTLANLEGAEDAASSDESEHQPAFEF